MDRVTATPEDVEYLLEAANFAIPDAHLGFEHVVATWAGLRPLVKPEGSMAASSVSREHQILTSPAGLLTIAGGKMTTARVMGLQVIERAVEILGANFGIRGVPASRSAKVPISGGDPGALFATRQRFSGLPLDPAVKSRWLERYGGNASRLADRAMGDAAAGRDLGAKQLTRAEVRQIYGNFAKTGAVLEEEKRVRADSGESLKRMLNQEDHRYVFTLIQKFRTEHGERYPVLSTRKDMVVITDEAHRSQYDIFAANMRSALPNAAFIGFTGTPLMAGSQPSLIPHRAFPTSPSGN